MEKLFLSANQLLTDSFVLAQKIYLAQVRPDWIVGVWRGGTPVAIAIHEYFYIQGHKTEHCAIQAISYTGIGMQDDEIKLFGLETLTANLAAGQQVLIVDDVFDSGRSAQTIKNTLAKHQCEILLAMPWYKPGNNMTDIQPDFYLHKTDKWLVFPHELAGLSKDELKMKTGYPG